MRSRPSAATPRSWPPWRGWPSSRPTLPSLLNANGERFVDQAGFPEEYRAEALAAAEALELLRATPEEVDWTYLSPPPENLTPGDAQGGYIVRGDNHPVTDDAGHTAISSGDLAAALVDELERPQSRGSASPSATAPESAERRPHPEQA